MKDSKRMLSLILALTMVLSMSVSALGNALVQFSDIDNHWAKEEIDFMTAEGVINGYEDGTFKPNNNMTRAELIKVIVHLMGYEKKAEVGFEDVKETDWFYEDVAKALAAGCIEEAEYLNPNELITREEVAKIIGIAFGFETNAKEALGFKDHVQISLSAKGMVGALKEKGYIQGYEDGTFAPKKNITRAEIVKMLFNVVEAEGIPEIVEDQKPKTPVAPPRSGGGSGGGGRVPDPRPSKVLVSSVSLEENVTSVVYGKTLQLTATIAPSNATNKSVAWDVYEDIGKASITQNGLLTAEQIGDVTVKATAKDGSGKFGELVIKIIAVLLEDKGVLVEADKEGIIDPGTELVVDEINDSEELQSAYIKILGNLGEDIVDKKIVSLFDIKLMQGNVEVQPNGNVRVKIKTTPEMENYDNLQVVHIDEDDNVTIKSHTVENGYIVFLTNSFSNYAIIGKEVDNPDQVAANEVIAKIVALPALENISLDDKVKVEAVREAYEGLTEMQQELVTNLNDLVEIEAKILEFEKAITITKDGKTNIYLTIQEAINEAEEGDTILVGVGTYREQLVIDKPITLLGPNAGVHGASEERSEEAVITYPEGLNHTLEDYLLLIDSDFVTIDGFFFLNLDDTINNGYKVGYSEVASSGKENIELLNNRIESKADKIAVHFHGAKNGVKENTFSGIVVEGNHINSISSWSALYLQGIGGDIENNTVIGGLRGIQVQPYYNSIGGSVTNNKVSAYESPIYHNYANKSSATWTYSDNEISAVAVNNLYQESKNWMGILVRTFAKEGSGEVPKVIFNNNDIDGVNAVIGEEWDQIYGIYFWNNSEVGQYEFQDNIIKNIQIGAGLNNATVELPILLDHNTFPEGSMVIGDNIMVPDEETVYNLNSGISYMDIQEAVDEAKAGDIILVGAGEFAEEIYIEKPIRLIGAGAGKTILSAKDKNSKHIIWLGAAGSSGYGKDLSGTVIKGFTINSPEKAEKDISSIYLTAKGSDGAEVVIQNNEFLGQSGEINQATAIITPYDQDIEYVKIVDNKISDMKYGMYFNSISNIEVTGNIIEDTRYSGIVFYGKPEYPCDNIIVKKNILNNIASSTDSFDEIYYVGVGFYYYGDNITVEESNVFQMLNDKQAIYYRVK